MVAKSLAGKKGGKAPRPGAREAAPDALLEEWAHTDAAAIGQLLALIPSVHLRVRRRPSAPAPRRAAPRAPRPAPRAC